MSTSKDTIYNDDNNNKVSTPAPLFRRYEFPLLADDPASFSQSRSDPLACNVNNDAVLIWNDVISPCDDPLSNASLSKTSIEDVFSELQSVAEAHQLAGSSYFAGAECVPAKQNGVQYESPVVQRRRLYEQGSNFLYGSKPDSKFQSRTSASRQTVRGDEVLNLEFENLLENNVKISPDGYTTKAEILRNDDECVEYGNTGTCDVPSIYYENVDTIKNKKGSEPAMAFDVHTKTDDLSKRFDTWHENSQLCNESALQWSRGSIQKDFAMPFPESMDSSAERSKFDSGHFEDMSIDFSPLHSPSAKAHHAVHFDEEGENTTNDIPYRQRPKDISYKQTVSQHGSIEDNLIHEHSSCRMEEYPSVFVEDKTGGSLFDCHCQNIANNNIVPSPKRFRPSRNLSKSRKHSWEDRDVPWRDESSISVRCENKWCGKVSTLSEARKSYKNCHHCLRTYYCSRECRRQDWGRHKQLRSCPGSCVSSVCKKVIKYCNSDPEVKAVLSRLATRGYLAHGRGCVMLGFPDVECAEEFIQCGFSMLELNPIYVSSRELSESKMYGNVLEKLLETCRSYKPNVKFVLNVGVGLYLFNREGCFSSSYLHHDNHSCQCHCHLELRDRSKSQDSDLGYGSLSNSINMSKENISPSQNSCCFCFSNNSYSKTSRLPSSSKYKGPILQRFIKLRLSPIHSHQEHEHRWTLEEHFWDEYRTSGPTLILSGIPERSDQQNESRKRELTFINIQRKLRQRNVNLRHQYPSVYSQLIDYVTRGVRFPSQIIFPVDMKTKRIFTCVMMPEAEAELEWMHSHHLLNDLDLSRNSLNKSMSRWASSSMPSLLSPTQNDLSSNPSSLEVKESLEFLDSKLRANSFTHINDDQPKYGSIPPKTAALLDVPLTGSPGEMKRRCSSHSDLTNENTDDKNNSRFFPSKCPPTLSRTLFRKTDNLLPLPSSAKTLTGKAETEASGVGDSDSNHIDHTPWEKGANTLHEAINQTIVSYYPVRKAANIKLYATPNKSLKKAPESCLHQHQPDGWSPVSPLPAPSSTGLASPRAPGSSSCMFTSTPLTKTAKPPPFEDMMSTPTSTPYVQIPSTPLNQIDIDNQQLLRDENAARITNEGDKLTNEQNIPFPVNGCQRDGFGSGGDITGYGFDSCYRNKVVVDEADRMKRRRKDRNWSKIPKASLTNGSDNWPGDIDFDSPPLATSTLSRNAGNLEGNENPKSSQRKKQRRDLENTNGAFLNTYNSNHGVNEMDNTAPSHCDYPHHLLYPDDCSRNGSKKSLPGSVNHMQENNVDTKMHEHNDRLCNSSKLANELKTNAHLPEGFHRNFNTNSQFFPQGPNLSISLPSLQNEKESAVYMNRLNHKSFSRNDVIVMNRINSSKAAPLASSTQNSKGQGVRAYHKDNRLQPVYKDTCSISQPHLRTHNLNDVTTHRDENLSKPANDPIRNSQSSYGWHSNEKSSHKNGEHKDDIHYGCCNGKDVVEKKYVKDRFGPGISNTARRKDLKDFLIPQTPHTSSLSRQATHTNPHYSSDW